MDSDYYYYSLKTEPIGDNYFQYLDYALDRCEICDSGNSTHFTPKY